MAHNLLHQCGYCIYECGYSGTFLQLKGRYGTRDRLNYKVSHHFLNSKSQKFAKSKDFFLFCQVFPRKNTTFFLISS